MGTGHKTQANESLEGALEKQSYRCAPWGPARGPSPRLPALAGSSSVMTPNQRVPLISKPDSRSLGLLSPQLSSGRRAWAEVWGASVLCTLTPRMPETPERQGGAAALLVAAFVAPARPEAHHMPDAGCKEIGTTDNKRASKGRGGDYETEGRGTSGRQSRAGQCAVQRER